LVASIQGLEREKSELGRTIEGSAARLAGVEQERRGVDQRLADMTAERDRLAAVRTTLEQEKVALQQSLQQGSDKLAAVEKDREAILGRLDGMTAERDRLEAARTQAERERAQVAAELERVSARMAALEKESADEAARYDALAAERDRLAELSTNLAREAVQLKDARALADARLAVLVQERSVVDQQIGAAGAERSRLEQRIAELEHEAKQLVARANSADERAAALEREKAQLAAGVGTLEAEAVRATNQREQVEARLKAAQMEKASLEERYRTLDSAHNGSKSDLHAALARIGVLEADAQRNSAERAKLSERIQAFEKEKADLIAQREAVVETLAKRELELREALYRIGTYETVQTRGAAERAKLEDRIASLEKERSALLGQRQSAHELIGRRDADLRAQQERITMLEGEHSRAETERRKLNDRIDVLENDKLAAITLVQRREADLAAAVERITLLEADQGRAAAERSKLEDRLAALDKEKQAALEMLSRRENEVLAARERIGALEADQVRAGQERIALESRIKALDSEKGDLESRRLAIEEVLSRREVELARSRERIEALVKERASDAQRMSVLDAERRRLIEEATRHIASIRGLERERQDLEAQIQALSSSAAVMRGEREESETRQRRLQGEIVELKRELATYVTGKVMNEFREKLRKAEETIVAERRSTEEQRAEAARRARDVMQREAQIASLAARLTALDATADAQRRRRETIESIFRELNPSFFAIFHEPDTADLYDGHPILRADTLFEPGSDVLRPWARARLARLAEEVKAVVQRLPPGTQWRLQIEGHVDRRTARQKGFASPLDFASARAAAVARAMLQSLPADRLSAVGHGDAIPLDAGSTEAARIRNSRLELVFQAR
jgi:chromosome segregation ATPase